MSCFYQNLKQIFFLFEENISHYYVKLIFSLLQLLIQSIIVRRVSETKNLLHLPSALLGEKKKKKNIFSPDILINNIRTECSEMVNNKKKKIMGVRGNPT